MAVVPTSKDDVVAYVKRKLAPGVLYDKAIRVILQPEDYDDAWADAVGWFVSRRGQQKRWALALVAGTTEYAIPSDLDEVLEFVPPGIDLFPFSGGATGFGFEETGYPVASYPFRGEMPLANVVEQYQYAEQAKRVLGSAPGWELIRQTGKLLVFPVAVAGNAIVVYKSNDVDYEKLSVRERIMVRDYAYASALDRLGTVFTKYEGGIPAPAGDIQLSTRLKDDAALQRSDLDEQIGALAPAAIVTA